MKAPIWWLLPPPLLTSQRIYKRWSSFAPFYRFAAAVSSLVLCAILPSFALHLFVLSLTHILATWLLLSRQYSALYITQLSKPEGASAAAEVESISVSGYRTLINVKKIKIKTRRNKYYITGEGAKASGASCCVLVYTSGCRSRSSIGTITVYSSISNSVLYKYLQVVLTYIRDVSVLCRSHYSRGRQIRSDRPCAIHMSVQ